MTLHHISCGLMRPFGGRLVDGFSHGLSARLVCHCFLIETEQGLVLIDTGFGLNDVRNPEKRLSSFFLKLNRIQFDEQFTAIRQIEKLGYSASDVRHILLTHMDFEQAGGVADFPLAQVHVLKNEWESAVQSRTWLDRRRYRPAQWRDHRHWNLYEPGSERWFGFACARQLQGLPPEILMIPLPGHTWGHAGVAVQTQQGWMLHAGDAYFYRRELEADGYHCTPGLRLYQTLLESDRALRQNQLRRLRDLVIDHSHEVRVCCSHDAIEFTALKAQTLPLRERTIQSIRSEPLPT